MSKPEQNLKRKFTYSDYLKWPEHERWELIVGIPYNMTPAPSTEHQRLVLELATILKIGLMPSDCTVFVSPFDVRLPLGDEEDAAIENIVQPDVVVVCDPTKIDTKGCKGAPDLIIEITSPSTFRKDLTDKYVLYETSGVKEYWIVYPDNKAIAVYRLFEGRFALPQVYTSEDTIIMSISPQNIELSRVFPT